MTSSQTKEGNRTMELAGVKLKPDKEREPERKEARGADRTDSRCGSQETIKATMMMATMAFVGILEALASKGRKSMNTRGRMTSEGSVCFVM